MLKHIIYIFFTIVLIACKQAPSISIDNNKTKQISSSSEANKDIIASDLVYTSNNIRKYISAHRGGKGYMGYPENCLETIKFLINEGIKTFEIDLASTKDNKIVLLHDDKLSRTTTGQGHLNDLNYHELEKIRLKDDYKKTTNFKIPLLEDVLNLAKDNNLILMLDFKRSVRYKDVINLIKKTDSKNNVVLISYNQKQANLLHKLAPEMMISVSLRNKDEYMRHHEKGIPDNKMIAFIGVKEPSKEHYTFLHKKGIMTILGTLGNLDKRAANRGDKIYNKLIKNGADILSSDRAVEAQKSIKK